VSVDRTRQASFALALVLSVGILFAPASAVPSAPAGTDLVVHVVLFAALAYTGLLAGLSRPLTVIALLVYAAASELIQSMPVLNRAASPVDWLADAVGIGVGVGLSLALRRRARWWALPH